MGASRRSRKPAADPIVRFRRWIAEAARRGTAIPEAMALATTGRGGLPSVRFVLLKGCDETGFVFFTDGRSRKGRELERRPRAALVFYWDRLGRQVRVEGQVERVPDAEADAYWTTRPRESRLAAAASHQSAPLASRAALLRRYRSLRNRWRGAEVPRPRDWTGFRVAPERIEFWTHREHRLHERDLFKRTGRGWRRTILQP